MRQIAVSLLSFCVVFPAVAGARLPVVNVASGSISARSAFGENVAPTKKAQPVSQKKVVARAAKKVAPVKEKISVDNGEKIIAQNEMDVLKPRRPSSDLWAKSDAPLRMPNADEFAVYRSDAILPEESLDTMSARSAAPVVNKEAVARASKAPLSQLDAQIALLNELQRRADASVEEKNTVVEPAPVIASVTPRQTVAEPVVEPVRVAVAEPVKPSVTSDDVKLRRMVVSAEPDVVTRPVVAKTESPRIAAVRNDMTKLNPTELRKAFRKTFLSENKHLSTYPIDDRFDVLSDTSTSMEGFTAKRDLSESGGIRPLEIKIKFREEDSALSRANYNLLTEYAGIVLSNPTRAIQISIPEKATRNTDDRKLAARRLAIIEQVLRDTGVSEHRIMPVLSQRNGDGFVLRMISSDQYETLTQQQRDVFGDSVKKKTYKSMSW